MQESGLSFAWNQNEEPREANNSWGKTTHSHIVQGIPLPSAESGLSGLNISLFLEEEFMIPII